jgi:hypothetical protein
MIRLFAILAAFVSADQAAVVPQDPTGEKAREVQNPPCPPRPGYEPNPTGPLDLSRQGLVFDPLAPEGVRPKEQEQMKPAPVNPSAVTLFPVPKTDIMPTHKKIEGEEDVDQDPHACRP